jgi:hypothetical protein
MRRELIAAALALTAGFAQAAAAPCMLVFGQGRNPTVAGGPDWDALNQRFNATVTAALQADGRQAHATTASSQQIDPQAQGLALLAQADKLGCRTLTETTVFAQDGQLVLRLRVYPLLPELGENATIVGLRIGAALFVTQRDLPASAVTRINPELLASQMAAEYLQHDRR